MSRNTPEYRAIRKTTGKLVRAVKGNISSLSVDLLDNKLITEDEKSELRNPYRDALERASDLVQLLTDKVEVNPANYHTLVKILEQDRSTFKDVLESLVLSGDSSGLENPPHTTKTTAAIASGIHNIMECT